MSYGPNKRVEENMRKAREELAEKCGMIGCWGEDLIMVQIKGILREYKDLLCKGQESSLRFSHMGPSFSEAASFERYSLNTLQEGISSNNYFLKHDPLGLSNKRGFALMVKKYCDKVKMGEISDLHGNHKEKADSDSIQELAKRIFNKSGMNVSFPPEHESLKELQDFLL
jgi:hypothetical protein